MADVGTEEFQARLEILKKLKDGWQRRLHVTITVLESTATSESGEDLVPCVSTSSSADACHTATDDGDTSATATEDPAADMALPEVVGTASSNGQGSSNAEEMDSTRGYLATYLPADGRGSPGLASWLPRGDPRRLFKAITVKY